MPAQSSLTDSAGGAITTQWSGTDVTVIAGIGGLAQVVVNAPSDVLVDSLFTARVDIVNVENLNAASYHVVFDPIVVQLVGVTGGIIAGTAVPVDLWNEVSPGIVSIVQSLSGLTAASGSGYLAELQFHVVGVEGTTSDFTFDYKAAERVLSNNLAESIPTEWAGTKLRVTIHETAALTVDAPAEVGEGGPFLARIDVSQVTAFNAATYDVVFDPAVLSLTEVRAGNIGGVAVPVDLWNEAATGTVSVVQDISGLTGASGSGYLSELRFETVGAEGQTSPIDLANVVLSDTQSANIPVSWTGAAVSIVAPVPPQLCTVPQPPNRDFGDLVVGTTAGWAFELKNCGGADLAWSITDDAAWITVVPTNGTTTLDSDIITVSIDTTGLAPDLRHSGRISISSNGGTIEGTISVTAREFPTDLTVTSMTSAPQYAHDGQTVTFTAVVANAGDRDSSSSFYTGFSVNGQPLGQKFVPAGLAVGDSVTVTQTWVARPGTTTVTVIADVNLSVAESDETNNELTIALPEIGPPDLTVTSVTSTPASRISHSEPVTFIATVRNAGTATTSRDFFVALLINGGSVTARAVQGLGVGASAEVRLHWSAVPPASTSTIVADSTSVVAESSEDNNRLSISLPPILLGDLRVADIDTQPPNLIDGRPAIFIATVENVGEGDVIPDFGVRFELAGLQILGVSTVAGGLVAGASTTVASPAWTASPGVFNITTVADSGQVVVESNESNNSLSTTTPTILSADLVVSGIAQSPSNPQDGEQVTLTATVDNVGAGNTVRDFVVGFEVDGAGIGSALALGGVASGSSTSASVQYTAGPGASTAKAIADQNLQVSESNEGNNELPVTLAPVPFPDVEVTAITRDQQAIGDGQLVTFTARVQNTGTGGTLRSSLVRLQIDGLSIGDALVTGGLAPASYTDVSKTWTATPGDHVVAAVADQAGAITESNEANNTLSEQLPTVASSDLRVSAIAFSPAGVQDGQTAVITATVENQGNGDVARSFSVRFEVDGVLVGRQQVTGGITAGQSVQVPQSWTAEAGSHTATVTADEFDEIFESNELNNSVSQILPGVPFADLTVSSIESDSASLSDGETVTLTATLSNVGAGTTTRPFAVQFEIDAVSLGTVVVSGGVPAGGSLRVSQTWAAVAGDHVVGVTADANDDVPESNEANNRTDQALPSIPYPDLTAAGLEWTPGSFGDGDTVALTAYVLNIGSGTTTRSFDVSFRVDGVPIGTAVVAGGLPPAATTTAIVLWIATPGQHTVLATVDASGEVPESNEANNSTEQALPAVAPPDLSVSGVTWTGSEIVVGETVTFQAAIQNTGAGTSRAFDVRFRIDSGRIGTRRVPGGLGAGASATVDLD